MERQNSSHELEVNKGTDDCIDDLPLIGCTTDTGPTHDTSLLNGDFALYQCELCGSSFNKERQYMGHLGSHSKEKIWNCVLCEGSFATNSQLLQHMSKHEASLNAFKCSKCPLTFGSGNRLNAHILAVHNNYRPFKCNECDKAFAKRVDLRLHQHIHKGLKKYPCEECGKEFSHASNLRRHKLHHSGLKPYICSVCKARYKQLANLKRHQKNHPTCREKLPSTENEPSNSKSMRKHHCGQCGLTFLYLKELKNHQERLHNTTQNNSTDTNYKTKHLTDLGRTVDALIQDMLCDNEAVNGTDISLGDSTNKQSLPDNSKYYDLNFSQMDFASQNNECNSDFLPSDILLINPYFNNFEPLINFECQPNTEYFDEDIVTNTDTKQNDIDCQNIIINTAVPIDYVGDVHLSPIDIGSANIPFDTERNHNEMPNFDFAEDSCANLVNRTNQPTVDSLNQPSGETNKDSMTIFEKYVDLEEGTNLTTNLNQLIGDNNVQFISAEDGDTFIIRLNSSIDAEQLSNMLNINIEVVDVKDVLNDVGRENLYEDPLVKMEIEDESPCIDGIQNESQDNAEIDVTQNVDESIDTTQSIYINVPRNGNFMINSKQSGNTKIFVKGNVANHSVEQNFIQNINVMQSDNPNEIVENRNLKFISPIRNNKSVKKLQNMHTTQRWVSNEEFHKFLASQNVVKDMKVVQKSRPSILRRVTQRKNPIHVMRNENPKISVKRKIVKSNNATQNESPNFNVVRSEDSKKIETRKLTDGNKTMNKQIRVNRVENPSVKVQNNNRKANISQNKNKIASLTREIIQNIIKTQSNSTGVVRIENEEIVATRKVVKNIEETQNFNEKKNGTRNIDSNTKGVPSKSPSVDVVQDEDGRNIFTQEVAKSCNITQNIIGRRKIKTNIESVFENIQNVNSNNNVIPIETSKVGAENSLSEIFVSQNVITNIDVVRKVINNINLSLSKIKKAKQKVKEKPQASHKCEVCSKVFARKDNYASHSGIHNPKLRKHKCRICQARFSYQSTLKKHMLAAHSKGKAEHLRCSLCTKTYHYPCQLKEHIERDHEKIYRFECKEPGCVRRFYRKYDLKLHMKMHKQTRTYACRRCSMTFVHSSNKIRHESKCLLRRYRTAVATSTQTNRHSTQINRRANMRINEHKTEKQDIRSPRIDWSIEPIKLTALPTNIQMNEFNGDSYQEINKANDRQANLQTNKQNTQLPNLSSCATNVRTPKQNKNNIQHSNVKSYLENRTNAPTNMKIQKKDVQEPVTESCLQTNHLTMILTDKRPEVQLPKILTNKSTNRNEDSRPIILSNVRIKMPPTIHITPQIQPLNQVATQPNQTPVIREDNYTNVSPIKTIKRSIFNNKTKENTRRQLNKHNNTKIIRKNHSNIQPDSYTNIKTSLQPDCFHPDLQPDIHMLNDVDTHIGSKSDKHTYLQSDIISDKRDNLQSDIHPDKQADLFDKVHNNKHSEMHVDIQPDEHYDMQSNVHTKLHSVMHSDKEAVTQVDINQESDVHNDIQSNIHTNLQSVMHSVKQVDTPVDINHESEVHVDTQYDKHYDMHSDEQFNILSDTQENLSSDTHDDLQTVMHLDIQTDINAHLLSEIQNEMHTSILSELQSEMQNEMTYSRMQSDTQSDIAHVMHTDVLSDLQSEIGSNRQSVIEHDITYSNIEDPQSDIDHDIHTKILSELQSDIQSDLQRALAEMPDSPLDSSYSSRQLLSDIDDLLKNKML